MGDSAGESFDELTGSWSYSAIEEGYLDVDVSAVDRVAFMSADRSGDSALVELSRPVVEQLHARLGRWLQGEVG